MSAEHEMLGLLGSLSAETRERAAAAALSTVRLVLRDDARWPRSEAPTVADVPRAQDCYVLSDEEGGHG